MSRFIVRCYVEGFYDVEVNTRSQDVAVEKAKAIRDRWRTNFTNVRCEVIEVHNEN